MKITKKIFITLAWLGVSAFLSSNVCAQLFMEHSRVTLTVAPGDTIIDSMALHNTSNESIPVKVYWQDFDYQPPFEGKKRYLPVGTSERSMGRWISFSPREFVLPPKGKQEINYTIKVPRYAQGSYNGVLFFEQGAKKPMGETGISIITRVGSLFFLETSNSTRAAKLENFKTKPNGLAAEFVNLGDTILFPKGVFYTLDEEGLVVDRGKATQLYLPPGERGEFRLEFSDELSHGAFTAVLTFDLGEGNSLVKEIDFVKDVSSGIQIRQLRD